MSTAEFTPGLRREEDLEFEGHTAVPHFTNSDGPVVTVSSQVTVDVGGKPQIFFRVNLLRTFGAETDWSSRVTEFLQSSIGLRLKPLILSKFRDLGERGTIGLYYHRD